MLSDETEKNEHHCDSADDNDQSYRPYRNYDDAFVASVITAFPGIDEAGDGTRDQRDEKCEDTGL